MTDTTMIDQLCQRMIEDIVARNRGPASRKSHLRAYERFAGWLQRSPDTATADEIRQFQLHLAETGASISTRNATMTGLRFLLRVTLRRHDLAADGRSRPESCRPWNACGTSLLVTQLGA